MKILNPTIEIIPQSEGIEGIYKQVELAGRTCYQSFENITEDSAKKFADRMIKSGHGAMLEHGTVYLAIPMTTYAPEAVNTYHDNPYSKVNECKEFIFTDKYGDKVAAWCVTTNLRVLIKNDCLEDLEFICEPTKYHEKRITIRMTTDIGVTREGNRHRVNSMAEMSTRYCNFSKDKFGNELSIMSNADINEQNVKDCLFDWCYEGKTVFEAMCRDIANKDDSKFGIIDTWVFSNLASEWSYMKLIKLGWTAQQARRILPLDTHSELVHTAFISDWCHFLSLRSPKYGATGVHPDMVIIADKIYDKFREMALLD